MLFLRNVLGIVALGIIIAGCMPVTSPERLAVRPTDSPERQAVIAANADLQAGQTVYNLRCAHCHGYAGEGQLASTVPNTQQLGMHTVPPHDATGHTWQHPTQLLKQVILQGVQNPLNQYPMPPFTEVVTDEEIDQLVAFMQLWWTDEQREAQAQVTERREAQSRELGTSDN